MGIVNFAEVVANFAVVINFAVVVNFAVVINFAVVVNFAVVAVIFAVVVNFAVVRSTLLRIHIFNKFQLNDSPRQSFHFPTTFSHCFVKMSLHSYNILKTCPS